MSVRRSSSTFSNDFSSEADSFHITHIASKGLGNEYLCFCSGRIRTLVTMATYNSHRLIMGKVYLIFFSQICLLSSHPRFISLLSKSLNLISCRGNMKGKILKNIKTSSQKP